MHSATLSRVMSIVISIYQMSLPWDDFSFSIWSYIVFCFVTYIIAYVIIHLLKFAFRDGFLQDN